MRRPVVASRGVTAVLVAPGRPVPPRDCGPADERVLPTSPPGPSQAERLLRDSSSHGRDDRGRAPTSPAASGRSIAAYVATLSASRCGRVDAAAGGLRRPDSTCHGPSCRSPGVPASTGGGSWFRVVPDVEPISDRGEQLVHDIRAPPTSARFWWAASAQLVDSKAAIGDRIPLAAGIIALATFVLLFLMFGSVVVPLKAIALNLLSLTATFGAMVWVFQEGHGAGILNFTPTGMTDTTTPILMFCIAFGLSMDYEVFLLSRIKEEHDRTGDNTASVAMGLERTGRIVTAAAALLAVTFLAFATSSITFIKLFGLGLALAVVVDATLVRATLVPAFMRLAGEANWWAPAPLRRLHNRFGLSEGEDLLVDAEQRTSRRRLHPRDRESPATCPTRRGGGTTGPRSWHAARDLLAETGSDDAVSVRAVAERVGVSTPSIYLHFADKDALIDAVCEEVFTELGTAMEEAAQGADDPFDSLRQRGLAYVQFALDNPEHYRIVQMTRGERGRRCAGPVGDLDLHEPRRERPSLPGGGGLRARRRGGGDRHDLVGRSPRRCCPADQPPRVSPRTRTGCASRTSASPLPVSVWRCSIGSLTPTAPTVPRGLTW